jgi:hypothetical protein
MAEKTWEQFVEEENLDVSGFDLLKDTAYIKKVGKQWCVFSEGGKRMGCYNSKPAAEKRLKQIEMFKHMKSGLEVATFYCYCPNDGTYFYTPNRCDQSLCPVCHDPDRDNIEVIGEF